MSPNGVLASGGDEQAHARFSAESVPGRAHAAQVHKARLHDGTEVAVKVQYAGLQTAVAADLGTFAALSAAAAWLLPDYQVPHGVLQADTASKGLLRTCRSPTIMTHKPASPEACLLVC